MHSALYRCDVMHKRLRPRMHRLDYRIFSMLLDLDALEAAQTRLFSVDRANLFSFHQKDRGDGRADGLAAYVRGHLARAGLTADRILLQTMPRMLGWAFNPLSIYFCYGRDGALCAILWEVDNTFGERHSYLIPVEEAQAQRGIVRQDCDKQFYVSPFMPMDLHYRFRVKPPTDRFSLVIDVSDAEGLLLVARQTGARLPLTDGALLRCLFAFPFLAARVLGGIHWEALKLWLKGIKLVPKRAAHSGLVSTIEHTEKAA